jgi:uncharacterized protein (DUF4213/DUF364 family)
MWNLYDDLINGIPDAETADEIICGHNFSVVFSSGYVGFAGTRKETYRQAILPKKPVGMSLRELASCVKSWNFAEASIGHAAINSWYNRPDHIQALGVKISENIHTEDRMANPFISMQKDVAGKKVTIVGHFPYVDQLFKPISDVSIIEQNYPEDGDYPIEAADYLMPDSNYVFISSYTLTEKTMPRFLKLSKHAHTTIVGPTCPVSAIFKDCGVNIIAGFCVKDYAAVRNAALGLGGNIYAAGQKINIAL